MLIHGCCLVAIPGTSRNKPEKFSCGQSAVARPRPLDPRVPGVGSGGTKVGRGV